MIQLEFMLPLVLLIGCPLLAQRIHGSPFAPWSVYGMVWGVLLGTIPLNLVQYVDVSSQTWIILVGSLVSFMLGSAFTGCILVLRNPDRKRGVFAPACVDAQRLRFIIAVGFVVGLVGIGAFVFQVGRQLGFSSLVLRPSLVRAYESTQSYLDGTSISKFLLYFNWLNAALSAYYLSIFGFRKERLAVGVFLFSVLTTLLLGERASFLLVVLWSFFVWSLVRSARGLPWRLRQYGLLVLVFGVCLLYFVVVGGRVGKSTQSFIGLLQHYGSWVNPSLPSPLYFLLTPYDYLASNVPALQTYMQVAESHYSGMFTFLPLFKILGHLGIVSPADLPVEVGSFVFVPFPGNVYTYLNVYFSDWGEPGVLICPAAVGAVTTGLYFFVRRSMRLDLVLITALFSHNLVMSVAVNRFISTDEWIFFFASIAISKFVSARCSAQDDPRLSGTDGFSPDRSGGCFEWYPARSREVPSAVSSRGNPHPSSGRMSPSARQAVVPVNRV